MSGGTPTDPQLVNLLAKKNAQLPDTNPGGSLGSEFKISSKPAVLASQIFSQAIPSDDLTINAITSNLTSTSSGPLNTSGAQVDFMKNGQHTVLKTPGGVTNISQRLISNGTSINGVVYDYIVKYNFIKLETISPGKSYAFAGQGQYSLTQQAINPANSPSGLYDITIYHSNGGWDDALNTAKGKITNEYAWNFDCDSGVLTFFNGDFPATYNGAPGNVPSISFWRYEGQIGLSGSGSGSGSGTSGTGPTGDKGSTGARGIDGTTGYTGDRGIDGNTGPTGIKGDNGVDGATGPTGSKGDNGLNGDKYNTNTTTTTITPTSTSIINLLVSTGLAYTPGNSVIVTDIINPFVNRFEGIVKNYNSLTGELDIWQIQNIIGEFTTTRSYNVNLDGIDGPTGQTGSKGDTGSTGQTGPQGLAGDKYNSTSTLGDTIIDLLNFQATLTISQGLAYTPGNSVVVSDTVNPLTERFEGTVQSYNSSTGVITIINIVNIIGTPSSGKAYNVNLDGIDGPTGQTGATGSIGPQGLQGDTGPTGYTGVTGEKGDRGFGDTGYTGEQGPTGYTGDKGDQGATGYTGEQGPTGYTGTRGQDGLPGLQGSPGTGDTGATGDIGPTGQHGDTGEKGDKGDTGDTGERGPTGQHGYTGEKGTDGIIDISLLTNYGKLDLSSNNTWLSTNFFNAYLDISDNSTRAATTQFVNNKIDAVIGASQSTLASINALQSALTELSGNALASIATTYAPLNSAQLTGKPTLVIDSSNIIQDSETTRIATVGYVLEKVAAGGSGSGSGSGNSDWYNTYLVNQPPPVVFDPSSAIVTSSAIYFKFAYPNQISVGFTTDFLPKINYLASYYTNSTTPIQNAILTNASGVDYIRTTSLTQSVVQGIVLVKSSGTLLPSYDNGGNLTTTSITSSGTVYSLKYGSETTNTRIYAYIVPDLNALDSTGNKLYVYYGNYNSSSIVSNKVTFDIFISSGVPAAPTQFAISGSATVSQGVFTWTAPVTKDTSNPSSTVSIATYKITGTGTKQKGYNQPSVPAINFITSNNTTSATVTGLYPSTQYTVAVAAQNAENSSYGASSSPSISFTTPDLTLGTTLIGAITSGVSTSSVKQVNNINASAISVILGASSITTNGIYIPIHLQADIASEASSIRTISSKINNNSSTVYTGPSIVFNGFSSPLQSGITVGPTQGISLTSTSSTDVYSAVGSTGYFLTANITALIAISNLVPSPYQYSLMISDQTTLTSSYNYYYDAQPGAVALASGGGFLINSISGTTQNVSGIAIINSAISVNTSLSGVTNIGKYFCNSGNIVTYNTTTGTISASETNFSNAGTWYSTDANSQNFINPAGITFTRTGLSLTPPSSDYGKNISLTATINGIGSSTALTTGAATKAVIIDTYSKTLVYNTFKQSLAEASLSTSLLNGYRIYSAPSLVNGGDIPGYTSGSAVMSTVGYNNSISINGGTDGVSNNYNTEMLVAEGGIITRGFDSTIKYFIDYSNYYNNTFNYSAIPSDSTKRFATFAWPLATPSVSLSKIIVVITFNSGTSFTPYDGGYQINNSNFILYYRVEQNNSTTPVTGSTSHSSTWIKGNSTSGTEVGAGNYNNTDGTIRYGLTTASTSGTTATFTLKYPNANIASNTPLSTLYIRIGAQNNANFKITNIQARLAA